MTINRLNPFLQRLCLSSLMIAIVFAVVSLSFNPGFSFLVAALIICVIVLALKEYYNLTLRKEIEPSIKTGIGLSILYASGIFLTIGTPYQNLLPLAFIVISLISIFVSFFSDIKNSVVNTAATLFGIAYLTIPMSCTIQINYLFPLSSPQDGRWWLFYLLVITYATDTFAFLVGKTFGSRKLAKSISPKKTWEGAIGGLIFGTAASALFAYLASLALIPIHLNFSESLLLGAVLSILAQLGDLAESLIKRDAIIKDSANIPGLGGFLDVIDSLIFTTPFLYLYLRCQNL